MSYSLDIVSMKLLCAKLASLHSRTKFQLVCSIWDLNLDLLDSLKLRINLQAVDTVGPPGRTMKDRGAAGVDLGGPGWKKTSYRRPVDNFCWN